MAPATPTVWDRYPLSNPSGVVQEPYSHWYTHPAPSSGTTTGNAVLAHLFTAPDQGAMDAAAGHVLGTNGLERSDSPFFHFNDSYLSIAGNGPAGFTLLAYCSAATAATFAAIAGITVQVYGAPIAASAISAAPVTAPALGGGVDADAKLTGIIDFGIGIANARFRDGLTSSRVEYFWDMNNNGRAQPGAGTVLGRGYTKAEIDTALVGALGPDNVVNEATFYRNTGLVNLMADQVQVLNRASGHGTQVMDLACGESDWSSENARRNRIIAVQLPTQNVLQTDGYGFDDVLHQAFSQIVAQALDLSRRAGQELPLVINLSFGTHAGPHDGFGMVEKQLEYWLSYPIVKAIMLPSGNSFQSRTHARLGVGQFDNGQAVLNWQVQPDSGAAAFMQIWQDTGVDANAISVRLTPPGGVAGAWLTPDNVADEYWEWADGNTLKARIYSQHFARDAGQTRSRLIVAIQPTKGHDKVPAGRWLLELRNNALGADDTVSLWIERGDTISGFPPRGRQSYFDDPDYVRYSPGYGALNDTDNPAAYVQRAGTITSSCTSNGVTVVAAYRRNGGRPCGFSSADLPRGAGVNSVIALAVESEVSRTVPWLRVASTKTGGHSYARGTSFASALATRIAMRDAVLGNPAGVTATLKTMAQTADPSSPEKPDKTRIGAGRIGEVWI